MLTREEEAHDPLHKAKAIVRGIFKVFEDKDGNRFWQPEIMGAWKPAVLCTNTKPYTVTEGLWEIYVYLAINMSCLDLDGRVKAIGRSACWYPAFATTTDTAYMDMSAAEITGEIGTAGAADTNLTLGFGAEVRYANTYPIYCQCPQGWILSEGEGVKPNAGNMYVRARRIA